MGKCRREKTPQLATFQVVFISNIDNIITFWADFTTGNIQMTLILTESDI